MSHKIPLVRTHFLERQTFPSLLPQQAPPAYIQSLHTWPTPHRQGFYGKGLIGEDIVGALQCVFRARGRAVEIPAILNDTVATLIALRYAEPATQLGIILGTGTNAAYQERIDRSGIVEQWGERGFHQGTQDPPLSLKPSTHGGWTHEQQPSRHTLALLKSTGSRRLTRASRGAASTWW